MKLKFYIVRNKKLLSFYRNQYLTLQSFINGSTISNVIRAYLRIYFRLIISESVFK